MFAFFAGKGGAGKTTSAAAHALRRAARSPVLVISTDPAHSLADVLGIRLGARPKRVARNCDAVQLDAPRAFARWLREHRRALSSALENGTWLDRADVDALLDLTIPGIDELVGLVEIGRLASDTYDLVVVDTAPTGHTLRLLSAPDTVTALAGVLDALQEGHRLIRQRFAGVWRPEAADTLIALIAEQASGTARLLRDSRRTSFHWITLPEMLSVAESSDGIAALEAAGMSVADIVINRLLPDMGPCPLCDRRRAEEWKAIGAMTKGIGRGRRVLTVPAQPREPRGIAALRRLVPRSVARGARPVVRTPPAKPIVRPDLSLSAFKGLELLFVGGKGGVGKTTVAASMALRLARESPAESVLLLSTDPAHSVADVLDAPAGDAERGVVGAPPNLVVRELDAALAFAARRDAFQEALDDVSRSLGSATASAPAAQPLIDLAPPGIDELFGMLSVVEARATHRVIVIDTAPTGHALRLLEMPDAAREWVQLLLRVLLKYTPLVRPGRLAAELVGASQSIRALQSVLRDPRRSGFLVVTRAAAVPRAETERLVRRLRSLGLSIPALVVNARTLTPGRCRRCRATAAAERPEMAALVRLARKARLRDCAIIQTPLAAPPPRGAGPLGRWAETWFASQS